MSRWIPITDVKKPEPGFTCAATVAGKSLVLCNVEDQLYAFENSCPHAGLPLSDGAMCGHQITCPFHGYTFDVQTGENVDMPNDVPIQTYAVRCEQDQLLVEMPEVELDANIESNPHTQTDNQVADADMEQR